MQFPAYTTLTKQAKKQSLTIICWKIAIVLLGSIGMLTCLIKVPGFWSSNMLDVVGPAWNYILIRALFHPENDAFFSIRFTPWSAFLLILGICLIIETSRYLKLYESTFDPFDYLAYVSLLLPCFLIDKWLTVKANDA